MGQIKILKGDITKLYIDAVVNAANSHMRPGGGVDGAISKAAGFEIDNFRIGVRVQPGHMIITPSFNMDTTRWVIHAVAPIYEPDDEAVLSAFLYGAYFRSLYAAKALGCMSVAFPCLGTGVYGWPKDVAAKIALKAMREHGEGLEIIVVCFDDENFEIYKELLGDEIWKPEEQNES